jgi:hypothetical protein
MQERSIHDNRVISYEVDGEARRIVLRTRFEDSVPVEYTDVIFEGVLAYYFENDNFGSILFSIKEVPVLQLVEDDRSLFEEGVRFGWPGPWNVSPESSIQYIQSEGGKAFEIFSSYGLSGWVIAETFRLELGEGTSV